LKNARRNIRQSGNTNPLSKKIFWGGALFFESKTKKKNFLPKKFFLKRDLPSFGFKPKQRLHPDENTCGMCQLIPKTFTSMKKG